MIRIYRLIPITCITLLSFNALADAPVIDDSENYALLEEQQAANERPVAREQVNSNYDEDQPALARESSDTDRIPSNNAELLNKLQGLQQEIQELRGQLEMQAHDLKQLQDQQLSFYKDLDGRIRGESPLKTAKNQPATSLDLDQKPTALNTPAPTPSAPAAATPAQPTANTTISVVTPTHANPADEQISYLAAYELVKNKRFDEALTAMQSFVNKYPQGGYTANAQYWLGELYLVKKDYSSAITHFDAVIHQFPASSKYSACLLKMGFALADSGHTNEARTRLQEVMKKYPDTNTAELAQVKLATLGG